MCLAPSFHDKWIVDSNTCYQLDTFSFQVIGFVNVARQMRLQENMNAAQWKLGTFYMQCMYITFHYTEHLLKHAKWLQSNLPKCLLLKWITRLNGHHLDSPNSIICKV